MYKYKNSKDQQLTIVKNQNIFKQDFSSLHVSVKLKC